MLKRFLNWFLQWAWAIVVVWFIAMYELISGSQIPWMHTVSNWLIVFVGGMMIIGFISQYTSR